MTSTNLALQADVYDREAELVELKLILQDLEGEFPNQIRVIRKKTEESALRRQATSENTVLKVEVNHLQKESARLKYVTIDLLIDI